MTLDRSREHGYIGWAGVSASKEAIGSMLGEAARRNGPTAARAGSVIEGAGFFIDLGLLLYTGYEWSEGDATLADCLWSVWGLQPGASTAELLIDVGFAYAERRGDYDFGWASPVQ